MSAANSIRDRCYGGFNMTNERQNLKLKFSLVDVSKPQLTEIKISAKSKTNIRIMDGQPKLIIQGDGKIVYSK